MWARRRLLRPTLRKETAVFNRGKMFARTHSSLGHEAGVDPKVSADLDGDAGRIFGAEQSVGAGRLPSRCEQVEDAPELARGSFSSARADGRYITIMVVSFQCGGKFPASRIVQRRCRITMKGAPKSSKPNRPLRLPGPDGERNRQPKLKRPACGFRQLIPLSAP